MSPILSFLLSLLLAGSTYSSTFLTSTGYTVPSTSQCASTTKDSPGRAFCNSAVQSRTMMARSDSERLITRGAVYNLVLPYGYVANPDYAWSTTQKNTFFPVKGMFNQRGYDACGWFAWIHNLFPGVAGAIAIPSALCNISAIPTPLTKSIMGCSSWQGYPMWLMNSTSFSECGMTTSQYSAVYNFYKPLNARASFCAALYNEAIDSLTKGQWKSCFMLSITSVDPIYPSLPADP